MSMEDWSLRTVSTHRLSTLSTLAIIMLAQIDTWSEKMQYYTIKRRATSSVVARYTVPVRRGIFLRYTAEKVLIS